jgi:hypothetical protein
LALFPASVNKLCQHLGFGLPLSLILSSAFFVTCLLFYLYIIGAFFKVSIYPLINRVTFNAFFEKYIVNEYVDNAILIVATTSWLLLSVRDRTFRYFISLAYGIGGIVLAVIGQDNIIFDIFTLLSFPLIIFVVVLSHLSQKKKKKKHLLNFSTNLTLRYVSLVVIGVSAIGIAFSIWSTFVAPSLESSSSFHIDTPSNDLFLLLSSFSTLYVFILVFCVPVKVLFKGVSRLLKIDFKQDIDRQAHSNNHELYTISRRQLSKQTKIGLLSLAMILSVILVLIPQHPSINRENQDIGVDTHYYVTWVEELAKSKSLSDFVYQSFIQQGQDGDRPFSLIFIFMVYQVSGQGNLREVIEHLPIILAPGIVLAFYFLTLEIARNERIALIAAFLGAVSIHTLGGIYAGFYANWLALIVGYISIVFFFEYLRSNHRSYIIIFSLLLIAVLFFHVYTWTILTLVTGIFLLAILLVQNTRKKKNNNNNFNNNNNYYYFPNRRIIWLLIFSILPSIVIDVAKVSLTNSSGGLERDIELAQTFLRIQQFDWQWQVFHTTIYHGLGGVFSNSIILIPAILWVLRSNMRRPTTVFLMIFLSTGLIPIFLGNWDLQTRVFYNIPFEIPAAIAIYYVSRRSSSLLVPVAACLWLLAISLITAINFI